MSKIEKQPKKAISSQDTKAIHIAFESIYNEYYKLICFVVMKHVDNTFDIEDIVQDTFVSFFNHMNSVKNIKYYLLKIAKNKSFEYLKKNKPLEFVSVEDIDYFQQVDKYDFYKSEAYDEILATMKKILNDKELNIIIEHCVYDMKFRDIAKKYDLSLNTVLSIYHRGIKKMRKGASKYEKMD